MAKYSHVEIREVAAALSGDSRLLIIDRLRSGPSTSTELATAAGIGLPAAQKQLALLQHAGLIESTKRGRVVTHRLRPEPFEQFADWLQTRRAFWRNGFTALESSLSTHTQEQG